jgi:hypothetical protein
VRFGKNPRVWPGISSSDGWFVGVTLRESADDHFLGIAGGGHYCTGN